MFTHNQKHRLVSVLLFFSVVVLIGCQKNRSFEFRGSTMGTFYQVKVVTSGSIDEPAIEQGIIQKLNLVDSLMSNWKPDSDVSRFGRHGTDRPLAVDPHTVNVVRAAIEIAELSNGALDPTISPLVELWGFGTREHGTVPTDQEIKEAMDRSGYQKMHLQPGGLSKDIPELTLNLSALAKGYAVDLVCSYLESQGITNYMVNVGGDLRVLGVNELGQYWRMAIEQPDSNSFEGIYKVAHLTDKALATSGDYRNFFEFEGTRYSHLIDPRTGWPIPARITSVSVIAPDCMTADGLATTLSIMPPKEGLAMIEKMPDVECMILVRGEKELEEIRSTGMSSYLQR